MTDAKAVHGLSRALGDVAMSSASDEPYVPKAVLVTGGAGFIASHFVIRYVKAHPDVKVRREAGRGAERKAPPRGPPFQGALVFGHHRRLLPSSSLGRTRKRS